MTPTTNALPRREARVLHAAACLLIAAAIFASPAPAEGKVSLRPKPAPDATSYVVSEFCFGNELNGSESRGLLFSTHLGLMWNRGDASAWGLAVSGDFLHQSSFSPPRRVGLSLRYRRWLDRGGALDATLGGAMDPTADGDRFAVGWLAWSPFEWAGIGAQVEYSLDATAAQDELAVYPTVHLAGIPGLSASVVGLGLAALAVVYALGAG